MVLVKKSNFHAVIYPQPVNHPVRSLTPLITPSFTLHSHCYFSDIQTNAVEFHTNPEESREKPKLVDYRY